MASSRVLVVYYSRTGTTRTVAAEIADMLDCDIEEIVEMTSHAGVLGYIRSLFEAIWRIPSPIMPPHSDVGCYDLVIIGTPVWAGSVSSPVRSYLNDNKAYFGEIAFFCTLVGRGSESAFAQMEKLTRRPPRARCAVKVGDVQLGREVAEVSRFVKAVDLSCQDSPISLPLAKLAVPRR